MEKNYNFDKVKKFVLQELGDDYSGHDYFHAIRVYNNAKKILSKTIDDNVNDKIVLLSTLLHDCVDHKLFGEDKINEQITKIKKLLAEDYSSFEIKEIIEIIQSISYSKNIKLDNINAQIVSDADRLDAIGAIGIIRTIEYGASKKRKFDDKTDNCTINHFYEKLLKLKDLMYTAEAKKIAIKRHEFLEMFLKEYYDEIN